MRNFNWVKLIIAITVTNVLAWLLLDFWISRYSGGVAEVGAGFLVFCQMAGYYICTVWARLPLPVEPPEPEPEIKIHPKDCPGHDWQSSSLFQETCVICKADKRVDG